MNETAQKILDYIKRLPETWEGQPLRQQALDNFDEKFAGKTIWEGEKDFIGGAFEWQKTPQKELYWKKIDSLIEDGTIQLLPEVEEKKDEFVWTDELALEFSVSPYSTISPLRNGLEQFKASKQRKCLFTTEDRVNIYHGDTYWYVEVDNNFDITRTTACSSEQQIPECKDFSTEAAAREYVRLNKPMYSLNDVKKTWLEYVGVFNLEIFIEHLQKLKS